MSKNEKMQAVNKNELMEIMGKDDKLIRECFRDFLHDSGGILENIKDSITSNDASRLSMTAHKFKGTLKYLAAFPAADLAYELEIMGKEENLNKAESVFESLIMEYEKVKEYMINY